MHLTCLVGNGPSIRYNPLLGISELTTGIREAFNDLAGSNAAETLAAFSQQINGNQRADFESLLGPLDTIGSALPALIGIVAPLNPGDWLTHPLDESASALRRLHRLGVGTALGLIADRASSQGQGALDEAVSALTNALQHAADLQDEIEPGNTLTIGTLNYDGLLHATLPNERTADLAVGYALQQLHLHETNDSVPSWPIRDSEDFPEDRDVILLHMHGSLGWLRSNDGSLRKCQIEDLRNINFWDRLATGEIDSFDPVVVLTDRKTKAVGVEPFALAYRVFRRALFSSRHWCIAGYSFLDEPVNQSLRDAAADRMEAGLTRPRILVLGLGDDGALANQVAQTLGDVPIDLFVDGAGIPDSVNAVRWHQWLDTE